MLIGSFDIQSLTHSLEFSSSLESIGNIEKMLNRIRFQYSIGESQYDSIWVTLNEAVNNAIRHGNEFDPGKKVGIEVKFIKSRYLRFIVTDEGKGFDPAAIPDPTDAAHIEEPGGRGIFLMKKLADGVSYSDFGKTVEIIFDLHKNTD